MYITILSYEPTNQVLTFELPEYTRGFQIESMEEYISVTLGFNTSNIDWQTHEDEPTIIHLHNQQYAWISKNYVSKYN